MKDNTNSLGVICILPGKHKKKGNLKKIRDFWNHNTAGKGEFNFFEYQLRLWLIQNDFFRADDYKIYRFVDGNIIEQTRFDVFVHVIKYVEKRASKLQEPRSSLLFDCAIRQCEDILIVRKGLLLSLPKIGFDKKEDEGEV